VAENTAFWHTTPLHYAPMALQTGRLYAQDRLAELGLPVRPRRTAARRDRKLGLSGYVHLSFAPNTPLLADKRARGWPHVLIEFSPSVADLPGAALVPYNHKAWRHREDFAPVTDTDGWGALLAHYAAGRCPSLELVVPGELPLAANAVAVHAATGDEAAWLAGLVPLTGLPGGLPLRVSPALFPTGPAADLAPYTAYADACRAAGRLLPPPDLPFD
jgi:hypothetical protein